MSAGPLRSVVFPFDADRPSERFWRRHSNPLSGWSRVPTGAVVVYAVYRRDPRLLVAALLWAAVNPVLFSPPPDESAWMTRAVLAERWWLGDAGESAVGLDRPNVYNAGGAVAFVYALYAAWRRRPVRAALGVVLNAGLKLQWLRALVERYDRRSE